MAVPPMLSVPVVPLASVVHENMLVVAVQDADAGVIPVSVHTMLPVYPGVVTVVVNTAAFVCACITVAVAGTVPHLALVPHWTPGLITPLEHDRKAGQGSDW